MSPLILDLVESSGEKGKIGGRFVEASPLTVRQQNLNSLCTSAKMKSSFSNPTKHAIDCLRIRSPKKAIVVAFGGDACWHYEARASRWCEQEADGFGKHGISVDVAGGSEWEASALAEEFADAIGGVNGSDELGVQGRIFLDEFGDEPGAGGLVCRVAIRGSRAAKNSCSCNLMRSQGGLLKTTSNPPAANASGNSSGQWKNGWRSASVPAQRVKPGVNGPAAEVVGERGGGDYKREWRVERFWKKAAVQRSHACFWRSQAGSRWLASNSSFLRRMSSGESSAMASTSRLWRVSASASPESRRANRS